MSEYVYIYRQDGRRSAVLTNDPKWLQSYYRSDKELAGKSSGICHRFELDGLECELRMYGFNEGEKLKENKGAARDVAELFLTSLCLDLAYVRSAFSRLH